MFTTVNKTGSDCQFEGHTIRNRCASDIDADAKNKSHDTLGVDQRHELERAKYRGCSSTNDLDRLNPALLGTACFLSGFVLGSFFQGRGSLKKTFPIYPIMAVSSKIRKPAGMKVRHVRYDKKEDSESFLTKAILLASASVYPVGLLVCELWSRFKPTLESSSHLEDWDDLDD